MMALVGVLRGDALVLLYLVYDWVIVCAVIGVLLMGVSAVRRLANLS